MKGARDEGKMFAKESVDEGRPKEEHEDEHDGYEEVGCQGRDEVYRNNDEEAYAGGDGPAGHDEGHDFVGGEEG